MSDFATYLDPADWSAAGRSPVVGQRVGFAESFAAALRAQIKTWGVMSLEQAFLAKEQEALDQIYEATGQRIDPLPVGGPFLDSQSRYYARYFEQGAELPTELAERERRVSELKAQFPDIPTYRDVWDGVKKDAQAAEEDQRKLEYRPGGISRGLGAFAGVAVGSMNPFTDPINALTLGVGGIGRTVAARIGSEFGLNFLAEGANQLLGVQEQRSLLGLEYGARQAIGQMVLAGAGAAALRGVGEGAVFGVRKLRGKTPKPIPTPAERAGDLAADAKAFVRDTSPFGSDAAAQRMFAAEIEARFREANDWNPVAATRAELYSSTTFRAPDTAVVNARAPEALTVRGFQPDEVRSRIYTEDPVLARKIAETEQTIAAARARIDEISVADEAAKIRADADAKLADLDARIADLQAQRKAATDPRKIKRLDRQIDDLEPQRTEAKRAATEAAKAAPKLPDQLKQELAAETKTLEKATRERKALQTREDRIAKRITGQGPKKTTVPQEVRDFLNSNRKRAVPLSKSADEYSFENVIKDAEDAMTKRMDEFDRQLVPPKQDAATPNGGAKPDSDTLSPPDVHPDYVEIGGVRVPRDLDMGNGVKAQDILDDLKDDDAFLQAVQICAVRM